jgi:hypothetical protein
VAGKAFTKSKGRERGSVRGTENPALWNVTLCKVRCCQPNMKGNTMNYVPSYEEAYEALLIEAHDELTREIRLTKSTKKWERMKALREKVEAAMESGEQIPFLAWKVHHAIFG